MNSQKIEMKCSPAGQNLVEISVEYIVEMKR